MKKLSLGLALLVLATLVLVPRAHAIVAGQVDTFENGTTMGWAHGVPGYLLNIDTGGPAGAGDHYLQLRADGNGAGGRLTTFNLQQWLGNYIAQGITSLEIDLLNQGAVSLSIRFAFKSQNTQNAPGYLSSAMILPVGSGWQHFSIALTPANFTAVGGPVAFNTFFSTGIGDARIINSVGTSNLNGDFVIGQVGIDNIRAVPEPGAVVLVLGGLLSLGGGRRFRARA
ncbi:MAG: hypothetical protein ABIR71_11185 [Chthoniobacterales bacterium]